MFVSFPDYPKSSSVCPGDIVRRLKKDYSGTYSTVYMLITDTTYIGDGDEGRLISLTELTVSTSYGTNSYSLSDRTLPATHDDMVTLLNADPDMARDALAAATSQESISVAEAHTAWVRAQSRLDALTVVVMRVL